MSNNNLQPVFLWTTFYKEFADALLKYKNNRKELLATLSDIYKNLEINYPFMKNGNPYEDICPFTVFGCFNKGITNENRIALMTAMGDKLGVTAAVPDEFDGIPVLSNMNAWFFGCKTDRKGRDIPNLWGVFEAGIHYADAPSDITRASFISCYDRARVQYGIKWNLSVGLYWIRPYAFVTLDAVGRDFLMKRESLTSNELANVSDLRQPPDAITYLRLVDTLLNCFKNQDISYHSFPEFSYAAWLAVVAAKGNGKVFPLSDISQGNTSDTNKRHYWLYSPDSFNWDEFHAQGIMSIRWDELG
ncbi:MAG: hypothetical protein LBT65_09395, partial [Synergistaceae bacterium]|nr:hypothetical protein [Synergistaceae bacterium]